MAYDAPEDRQGLQLGRRQFMTWSAGGAYVFAMVAPTDALAYRRPATPRNLAAICFRLMFPPFEHAVWLAPSCVPHCIYENARRPDLRNIDDLD